QHGSSLGRTPHRTRRLFDGRDPVDGPGGDTVTSRMGFSGFVGLAVAPMSGSPCTRVRVRTRADRQQTHRSHETHSPTDLSAGSAVKSTATGGAAGGASPE